MKNLLKIGLLGFVVLLGIGTWVNAEDFFYDNNINNTTYSDNLEIGEIVKGDAILPNQSVLDRLFTVFGLDSATYLQGPNKAEYYIKMVLNMILGLVSLISLVLIIYAFYLILFVKQEEGVAKARKIIIGVFIALFIMGMSWLIVSFIFWFLKNYIL
ncbi:hypothetical protein K9M48_02940 [Candidatus Gracilibacteria bacterium]|nr:hypothetical protein [Candidatus Gracilibacteria bacterium]